MNIFLSVQSDIAKHYDDLHLCAKLYDLHGEGVYQIDGSLLRLRYQN